MINRLTTLVTLLAQWLRYRDRENNCGADTQHL